MTTSIQTADSRSSIGISQSFHNGLIPAAVARACVFTYIDKPGHSCLAVKLEKRALREESIPFFVPPLSLLFNIMYGRGQIFHPGTKINFNKCPPYQPEIKVVGIGGNHGQIYADHLLARELYHTPIEPKILEQQIQNLISQSGIILSVLQEKDLEIIAIIKSML